MNLKSFLQGFGILAVVITMVPIIAADYWWIRMFDYPHIELTLLTLTAIAAYFIRFEIRNWRDYAFMVILTGCFVYQFAKLYPYTVLSPLELNEPTAQVNPETGFKVVTANVLQKNEISDSLISEMKRVKPDIAVFTETNSRWKNEINNGIGSEYPFKVEVPLPNTYGMMLYSKLELINPEVKYLVDDSIPSIHAEVRLRSGDRIRLHAIHPTPPMPQHNPSSSDRDAEMMKVALEARNSAIPVLVIGDFNDVPWSQTVGLFKRVGELLDVRQGRSFYNTFDAGSFIMRWPLDHIFLSEEFRVKEIAAGPNIESDHFHFYAELFLQPELANEQKPEPASLEDLEQARKQIEKEQEEDAEKGQNGSSNN
ncbi:endonuclease/exonuclease/phosphatase family protein [Gramella sp. GC03-9]|uniref:Endonuclease/exonuclease/phosphatase family protein n=1 Tax=Christiangramia oceanisediminis TaxID=2920386 RepID=A0A9X2RCT7_9FLAO|nr:endonuclease/exonuclease/phosphatase family protein [Gramella oceanisediminis]MCP9200351.1 endonuclease/exonuclease/phosphatase family protein [Gramella oceanisediminis]